MDASNVQCYKYDFISLKLVLIVYTRVNYKLLAVNRGKKKESESHWKFLLIDYAPWLRKTEKVMFTLLLSFAIKRSLNTVGNKK